MGALSNSGRKAANMAGEFGIRMPQESVMMLTTRKGMFKSIQSVGGAISWHLDGSKMAYNTIFGVTWGLLGGSLVAAAPVIILKIKDHVTIEEDLKFSDETIEDVIAGPAERRAENEA